MPRTERPRRRLALCSPFPPLRSGIADYSVLLVEALAGRFELRLFQPGGGDPAPSVGELTVKPLALLQEREHDAVLYQLGNDATIHAATYRRALRLPGIVTLHEFVLHHLVRDLAGGLGEMRRILERTYGSAAAASDAWRLDREAPWRFPLFEPVVSASRGVLVHSDYARKRVRLACPDVPVEVVPHPWRAPTTRPSEEERALLRQRLGLGQASPLLGCFGFLNTTKRIEVVLRAFAALRLEHPQARLLLVGDRSALPSLRAWLPGGTDHGITLTGSVDTELFERYMQAVDVAINLRFPSSGETSGTLMRLLGHGRPTVVSDAGSFAEIDDDCAIKISPLGDEARDLLSALLALCANAALRRSIGAAAERYVRRHHAMDVCAERHAEALHRCIDAPAQPAVPLPSPLRHEFDRRIVSDVAAALDDLGFDEHDRTALRAVSDVLDEFGLG